MISQGLQRLRQAVDADRGAAVGHALPHDGVGEERQGGNVVQMRMADQDMVDACKLLEAQVTHAGSGVEQDGVVQQEAGGPASGGDGAGTSEYTNSHGGERARDQAGKWAKAGC